MKGLRGAQSCCFSHLSYIGSRLSALLSLLSLFLFLSCAVKDFHHNNRNMKRYVRVL